MRKILIIVSLMAMFLCGCSMDKSALVFITNICSSPYEQQYVTVDGETQYVTTTLQGRFFISWSSCIEEAYEVTITSESGWKQDIDLFNGEEKHITIKN